MKKTINASSARFSDPDRPRSVRLRCSYSRPGSKLLSAALAIAVATLLLVRFGLGRCR